MNIEKIMKELENNEEIFKLTFLYLKVKGLNKNSLIDLYEKGKKMGQENISQAIYLAIKDDKETMNTIKEMIEMEAIGGMDIPSYKETMNTMKEHTPEIDPNIVKKVLKK